MSGSSSGPPKREQQRQFVASTLERRLDEHPAWPANIFKLELEGAEIYQDRTGEILSDLLDNGEVGKTKIPLRWVRHTICYPSRRPTTGTR